MKRLQTPWGRFTAYLEAYFLDHQLLRKFNRNFYKIDHQVYRSNHPSARFIKKLKKQYGLKTIISFRKVNSSGQYLLEKEACDQLGIRLVNKRLSSKNFPRVERVLALKNVFEEIEKPVLLHCRSGADRAGMASVLYCHFMLGEPIREAIRHLHWRYGHFKYADTGRLDFFFESFLAFEKKNPDVTFIEWLENHYDRKALKKAFKPSGLANLLVNMVLRRE